MRAVVFERHGGPEELQWTNVPQPDPGPGEVLVQVRACALNHLDIWVRQGLPGIDLPLPHISGSDVAGEVAKLGPGVKGLRRGTRVIVNPGQSCEKCEFCRKGYDSLCPEYRLLGLEVDGGYAEFVKVPARSLMRVSEKLSFEEWAAIPLVFLTAWHMLVTRAALKPGETVLVQAAGSGVGSAAIQIAKWVGAKVFATAGSGDKLAKARKLGADEGIDYRKEDFSHAVRRLTGGRGVDVVFEHIGPETMMKSLACLTKGGRIVTCGATSGPQIVIDLRFLFVKQLTLLGSYMGGRDELRQVVKLVENGVFKPVIDSTFPLREARKAQEHMLDRRQFGKIVLAP